MGPRAKTHGVAEKGGVGLTDVGEAGEDEAEEALGGQAGDVLDEGDGVEGVGAAGVGTHSRDDALGGGGGAGAEGEEEGGCLPWRVLAEPAVFDGVFF